MAEGIYLPTRRLLRRVKSASLAERRDFLKILPDKQYNARDGAYTDIINQVELDMTLPAIIFGIVLSTAYGTAFHFWKGGSLPKLFLYVLLAWLGFWIGQFVGGLIGWSFAPIGQINTGMATLGSAVFLFVGEWLGRVEITHKK